MRTIKIVSGGQTGVDRGALDAAMAVGVAHGGWCARGRLAEDGRIPDSYQLVETESPEYAVRTERNVLQSDATLSLHRGRLSGGTELTWRLAQAHARPCMRVDWDHGPSPEDVRCWIETQRVGVLNVAGPRESQSPGIGAMATEFLQQVLAPPPR